jgi:hypothetical protein
MAQINPFQGPINYAVDVQSPFEAALGGIKVGAAGAEMQAQAQARAQALQNQAALRDLFKNPNATAADYARVTAFLPKDQAGIVQQGFEAMTKEQQQNTLRVGTQAYTAIKAGNLDVAQMQLKEQAEALRNSGREKEAQGYDDLSNLIRLNPTGAQTTIGLSIAQLPGGKDFLDNADKTLSTIRAEALAPAQLQEALAKATQEEQKALNAVATAADDVKKAEAENRLAQAQADKAKVEAQVAEATKPSVISEAASKADKARVEAAFAERLQQAGLNKTNWDIKNLQSQIGDRAAKLNLDRQTTQATVAEKLSAIQQRLTDIPDGAMKLINEAATQSATSKQAATQYNDLAQRIESAEGGKGRFTSAAEWFAAQTGRQDAWTQIRNEYTRIRNTVAIKSLPPGPATDADIQLALRGIPPETANAATLASFLRGTAKLQDIDSAISNAKTDWLSQNKGVLTRAKTPFIAGDYAAKPGETFNDFAQRIVADVSAKYRPAEQVTEERRQQLISQIPTNQAPAAAAPSSSIEAQADAIIRGGR